MSSPSPWSIKGIPPQARAAAKAAAQREGLTLGAWLVRKIQEDAAELGTTGAPREDGAPQETLAFAAAAQAPTFAPQTAHAAGDPTLAAALQAIANLTQARSGGGDLDGGTLASITGRIDSLAEMVRGLADTVTHSLKLVEEASQRAQHAENETLQAVEAAEAARREAAASLRASAAVAEKAVTALAGVEIPGDDLRAELASEFYERFLVLESRLDVGETENTDKLDRLAAALERVDARLEALSTARETADAPEYDSAPAPMVDEGVEDDIAPSSDVVEAIDALDIDAAPAPWLPPQDGALAEVDAGQNAVRIAPLEAPELRERIRNRLGGAPRPASETATQEAVAAIAASSKGLTQGVDETDEGGRFTLPNWLRRRAALDEEAVSTSDPAPETIMSGSDATALGAEETQAFDSEFEKAIDAFGGDLEDAAQKETPVAALAEPTPLEAGPDTALIAYEDVFPLDAPEEAEADEASTEFSPEFNAEADDVAVDAHPDGVAAVEAGSTDWTQRWRAQWADEEPTEERAPSPSGRRASIDDHAAASPVSTPDLGADRSRTEARGPVFAEAVENALREQRLFREVEQAELNRLREDPLREELLREDRLGEDPLGEDPPREDPFREDPLREDPLREDLPRGDPLREPPLTLDAATRIEPETWYREDRDPGGTAGPLSDRDAWEDDREPLERSTLEHTASGRGVDAPEAARSHGAPDADEHDDRRPSRGPARLANRDRETQPAGDLWPFEPGELGFDEAREYALRDETGSVRYGVALSLSLMALTAGAAMAALYQLSA